MIDWLIVGSEHEDRISLVLDSIYLLIASQLQGDPMLIDERGDGYKFENGVDGIRKVKMEPPRR